MAVLAIIENYAKKITGLCLALAMIATLAVSGIAKAPTIWASEGNTLSISKVPFVTTALYKEYQDCKTVEKSTSISIAEIKERIADLSQKYGLDYDQFYTVVKCESHLKAQYGDNGKAFGLAQFHKATFDGFCKGKNYYNSFDQLDCMAQMFSQGFAYHWTCFNKLYPQTAYNK